MASGFQQHQEAIDAAFSAAIALEERVQLLAQEHDHLRQMLINAVGEVPGPESARNATNAARIIGDKLDEIFAQCAIIGAELTRYQGGF